MSDNDIEDIEVQLEDDAEQAEEKPAEITPDEGIAELKAQLEQEKQRRIEMEARLHQQTNVAAKATAEKEETEIQLVANAIDTLNRDNDILKSGYEQAMRMGDFGRAAEIQQEMGSNSAKLLQLNNGLEAMKAKPKVQPVAPPPVDPVEAFASRLSPRSAQWVRDNPDFVRDPRLNRKMIAAHELAVSDGIAPDTDAYFDAIEKTLGVKARADASQEEATASSAKVVQRRDAAPAAAPVSRGTPSRSNAVRLTAAEREMADMMGMKHEDYARNKLALQKEGKLQ
jgi:hypothetical protein